MDDFFQTPPSLGNQYDDNQLLRLYLIWKFPSSMLAEIEPGLKSLGQRVADEILILGQQAEACPPRHIPYDPWGKRIDHIEVTSAWKELDRISAEEELIAIGYKRHYGAWSRIHQFAKLYLFHPSSAIYTCPLAMTDGAALPLALISVAGSLFVSRWNRSEKAVSSSRFLLPCVLVVTPRTALLTSISSSKLTPRNLKSCSGEESRREPTPYRVAATCLHIVAQSGQSQESFKSCSKGNKPPSG